MNTHVDKTQENKSQSVSNEVAQKQSGGGASFQFVDNRPEAIAQRKLQELANNSPQAKQAAQLQAMADNHSEQHQQPIQKKENNTGLPDNLKTGIENLSGYSMDDVKVHRNSIKPSQLQAHAYAQGTDIHLGSGKEKHLPHEAWHVVQQKQGRVSPTVQMKGEVNINDDNSLENEADMMGARALKYGDKQGGTVGPKVTSINTQKKKFSVARRKSQSLATKQVTASMFNSSPRTIQLNGHISQIPKEPRFIIYFRLTIQELFNLRATSKDQSLMVDEYLNRFGGVEFAQAMFRLLTLEARQQIPMIELERQFEPWRGANWIGLHILERIRQQRLRFVSLGDLMARADQLNISSLQPSFPHREFESVQDYEDHLSRDGKRIRDGSQAITPSVGRRRERGFYGSHAGDHTTAHAVLRRWIEFNFKNAPREQVAEIANRLIAETDEIFERSIKLIDNEDYREEVKATYNEQWGKTMTCLKLLEKGLAHVANNPFMHGVNLGRLMENLFYQLINLRNTLPTAAMEFGGTGGGEGTAIGNLTDLENGLRSGTQPELLQGLTDEQRSSLATFVIHNAAKLFDKKRTQDELSGGYTSDQDVRKMEEEIDLYSGPVLSGDRGAAIDLLINIHIETLLKTFPSLFEWLGQNGEFDYVLQGIYQELGNAGQEFIPDEEN